jgi:hypothetical protein
MTPLEINTAARQRMNAVNDDFWPDAEIYNLIYQGSLELANEGLLIERTFTASTVAAQQEYDWPTNAISIKRIQVNGLKLKKITFREDDVLTFLNQSTSASGAPTHYAEWNNVFYLRPIPSSVLEMKVWAYVQPQAVTLSSSLEIPDEYHMALVNFILSEMSAKNKNYTGAQYYRALWEKDVLRAKRLARKKLIGDAFQVVKNVDVIPQSDLGIV